jgi:hypothetical protein
MEFFKLPTNRVVELGSQLQNLSVAGDPPWPRRRVSKPAGLVATFAPQTSLAAKAPPPWSAGTLSPGSARERRSVLGEVVRSHLDVHPVAHDRTDAVSPHFPLRCRR